MRLPASCHIGRATRTSNQDAAVKKSVVSMQHLPLEVYCPLIKVKKEKPNDCKNIDADHLVVWQCTNRKTSFDEEPEKLEEQVKGSFLDKKVEKIGARQTIAELKLSDYVSFQPTNFANVRILFREADCEELQMNLTLNRQRLPSQHLGIRIHT